MLKISCPNCQHRLSLQPPKPGRYQPKCPKCSVRFALTVPASPDETPVVDKLAGDDTIAQLPTVPANAKGDRTSTAIGDKTQSGIGEQTVVHVPTVPSSSPTVASVPTTASAPPPTNTASAAGEATLAADPGSTTAPGVSTSVGSATTPGLATTPGFATSPGVASPGNATTPGFAAAATRADVTVAHHAGATAVDPAGPSGNANPLPDTIGGYRIVKQLGHGAMGDVYLARQISLDRHVAIKTIRPQWASNPAFIARFTREAYAAAQLTHHNVVQIYDLGVDGDHHYFSMEFVRGEALDQIVKREGPLAPRVAAGYVLQAARGLLFAHQFGMVHRDVKPANLMLNDQGLVKVADLGLVKVPVSGAEAVPAVDSPSTSGGSQSGIASQRSSMLQSSLSGTLTHFAVGTPAYMPPEQVDDAANVDQRADIYSLGCTLYALLAGRSPFEGMSVMEMIDRHRHQRIELPAAIREKTPAELLAIVERMTAKRPADRYADLQVVIADLEKYMNGPSRETPAFRPEDADELEQAFRAFNAAPGKSLRKLATFGAFAAAFGLAIVSLPFSLRMSFGAVIGLVLTIAAYVLIAGVRDRTYLSSKLRQTLSSLRWADWASLGLGAIVLFLLLVVGLGIIGTTIVAVVSLGAAWCFHEFVDRKLAKQRQESVERLERLLKHRRLSGVDETALRQFVAQHAGTEWEEGFEQLFGYAALLEAREAWGQDAQGRARPRFRPWRDTLLRSLEARIQAARDAQTRKVLAKVETQQLVASGLAPAAAREQADAMAEGLVRQAASARTLVDEESAKVVDPRAAAELKRQRIKAMLASARSGNAEKPTRASTSIVDLILLPWRMATSPRTRFLVGCLLLIGGLWWAQQNGLLSRATLDQAKSVAQEAKSGRLLGVLDMAFPVDSKPLPLPLVGGLFSSIVPGVAGLMLIVLSVGRGWKWIVGSLLSAGLMLFGPSLGVPGIEALGGPSATCLILGLGIGLGTWLAPFGRR